MIRALSITAGLGVLALAAVAPVVAQNGETAPAARSRAPAPADWLSVSEIATRLEAQGYDVREVEREDRAYEIEAVDANGFRVEAHVDPITGAVLNRDDDDRRRDDARGDDD